MDDEVLRLFASLSRQGPGSDRDTAEVLALVGDALPPAPRIADFGCGTGGPSLALARALPSAAVTAVDRVTVFIEALAREAEAEGLSGRVRAAVGDMLAPGLAPGTLDLVWSEGAAYAAGFEAALRAWRPLLRAGGRCVVSECEWLTDHPPAAVEAFWRESYPGMAGRRENVRRAEAAGYEVLATRVLSDAGWQTYYAALAGALGVESVAARLPRFAAHIRREMDVWERSGGSFGYVFYVLRPRPEARAVPPEPVR